MTIATDQSIQTRVPRLIIEPLLVSSTTAAAMVGLSLTAFKAAEAGGQIGPVPVRFGRRKVWSVEALRQWTAAGCPSRQRWIQEQTAGGPAGTLALRNAG